VLEPAATLAQDGFAVTERIHEDWAYGAIGLATDPDGARTYLVNGKAPEAGALFRNPDLARTFRVLQKKGRDAFYRGEIAEAIVAKVRSLGGTMTPEDLERDTPTWEEPISTTFRGYDVYELPPNTQGFAVLEMLNILDVCPQRLGVDLVALGPRSPLYWHLLVEAKKLAYADLYAFNADPQFAEVPVAKLISKDYAAKLCPKIDMKKASTPEPKGDPVGGTVYLVTADRWGNMVSFIYSVYDEFGSGIVVPGYGFVLNDRAALFSLDPKSPNLIAPQKRPFHTLIPGFVMKDGQPWMAFGLMGGGQQAQGHVQVLLNRLAFGANGQAASDAARFAHSQSRNRLALESGLFDRVGAQLKAMGHDVVSANGLLMGGYQSITRDAAGVYRAASDHRKDGQAAGW
jgi:gamma-glutamyltranspeptidase/glutathione hydrolase